MNKIDDNQQCLFDDLAEIESNKINIVKSKFISVESTDAKELFEGFDRMWAITFSSGIHFMSNVLKNFSDAEVIFGCRDIINKGTAAAMAIQAAEIEEITKDKNAKYLANRIDE